MRIEITKDDITTEAVDAIVNAANSTLGGAALSTAPFTVRPDPLICTPRACPRKV